MVHAGGVPSHLENGASSLGVLSLDVRGQATSGPVCPEPGAAEKASTPWVVLLRGEKFLLWLPFFGL